MIFYLDFEHHVDFLLRRPRWRASNWRSCLPTSALAPPQVNQVRLLVPKEVHKQLVLESGEGDLDGSPGQVTRVVEGGRFVDFLFCLVATLLGGQGICWIVRLFLMPYLCLLMGLGSLR